MKKRILIVFHNNFLDNSVGCNSYVFEIVSYLKRRGCIVDFFSFDNVWDNFQTFEELNKKFKLVDNFYLHRTRHDEQSLYETEEKTLLGWKKWKFLSRRTIRKKRCGDSQLFSLGWMNTDILNDFQKIISKNKYDFINIHYIQPSELLKYVTLPPETKCVYTAHDAYFMMSGFFEGGVPGLLFTLPKELEIIGLFQKVFCISFDEMSFFMHLLPDVTFFHLSHPLKKRILPEKEKTIDILFLGFMNMHNMRGLQWFIDKVMPHLKPGFRITFCGKVWWSFQKDAPEYLKKASRLGIRRIDFVEDLDDLYAQTKLSICPLQSGTGMKIKTIDSMARGIPMVSTTYGVDGFADKFESGCLISNDPATFADYINRMLTDAGFYQMVKDKADRYFDRYLSLEQNAKILDEIFELKENCP